MLKIYLDNCCYNRPFDDLKQTRIKDEAEAVNLIMSLSKKGKFILVSSVFIDMEINRNRNELKRKKVLEIYRYEEYYKLNAEIEKTAVIYQTYGLKPFDSLHLAAAENNHVSYLLTTDDDFIKISMRFEHDTIIMNPYDFIKERAESE
jgi:predicted nucleic acid-binding protein